MSTAIEGRLIRLEILARQFMEQQRAMMADLLALKRDLRAAQLGGYNSGGGSAAPPDTLWVEVPSMIPGAVGTGVSPAPRTPSQFTATVRRVKVPYDSGSPIENISSATVRWWGNSILYPLECIPVVKAADGAYDARWRHNIVIGTVYIDPGDIGDEPSNGMFRIDNCTLYRHGPSTAWPPTYSDPGFGDGYGIGTVWAFKYGAKKATNGLKVMVHMLPDICLFSIFE